MIHFNKDIHNLTARFEHIQKETSNTPLLSTKTDAKIEKLAKEIFQTKTNLETRISGLKEKGIKIQNPVEVAKQLEKLNELEEQLKTLRTRLPVAFQAKETRNVFRRIFSSTFEAIGQALSRPMRLQVFLGGNAKINHQKNLDRLNKIENEMSNVMKKQSKITEVYQTLGTILEANTVLSPVKKQKIEAKMDHVKKLIIKLNTYYNKLQEEESKLTGVLKKKEMNFRTAEKMRESCKILGGERVTLTTADQVKLDSIYLDASRFRNKLADAGCKLATIKTDTGDVSSEMNALFISKEDYNRAGKEVFDALEELRAFAKTNSKEADPGAGWQIVQHPDGIFIVHENEFSSDKEHPFMRLNPETGNREIGQDQAGRFEYTTTPIDTESPASGTAIITSGNSGVYEMHKNEAAFYLLRNMNVMLFNFRGYGESEGRPAQSGMKLDIESAYQYAKMRSKHPDKQIVFKSLCMSGAFAAYMASKHPRTNIILDQSFSSFGRVMKEKLTGDSQYRNIPKILKEVAGKLISSLTIDIHISKHLAKNEGKKAILFSLQDEMMSMENVVENVRSIAKAGKLGSLTLMPVPGKHSTSVTRIKASPSDFKDREDDRPKIKEAVGQSQIDRFLRKANLGHSLF